MYIIFVCPFSKLHVMILISVLIFLNTFRNTWMRQKKIKSGTSKSLKFTNSLNSIRHLLKDKVPRKSSPLSVSHVVN